MARKDIEQAIEDVKAFDQSVANLTLDRANEAKKEEISYYEVLRIIIIKGLDINYVKAYAINKRFKK